MGDYVSWFIQMYINNFSNLCNEKFKSLVNCSKMPTSCTIFARVIFYSLFNNVDPNEEDSNHITSNNIDTEHSVIPNIDMMMMDRNLHKIDIWADDDVVHAFVIYYNDPKFKIAQSYGDDYVCMNPAIYDIDRDSLIQIFKSIIKNDENSIMSYKALCGLSEDANIGPLNFENIEITSIRNKFNSGRGVSKRKKSNKMKKKKKMKKMKKSNKTRKR
jgi:hypothetical protein